MFLRNLLTSFLFVFILTSGFSQNFKGGVFVGLAASQVSADNLAGFNKPGMIFGGYTATPIGKKAMMQFELKFIQKGSWAKNGRLSNYKLNLNYIDAPLLLKYPYKKFTMQAGLSLGTLLTYTEKTMYGDVNDSREFNRFELAGILGAEYILTDKLIIDVKYNNSLLPIREHVNGNKYRLNWGQYSTVIEMSLRYEIKRLKN